MATIANLDINMGARTERLKRGLKAGYGAVNSFVSRSLGRLKSFSRRATGFLNISKGTALVGGLAAATAGYVGITNAVGSFNAAMDRGDNLAKTSDKLGVMTQNLQRLRHASITTSEIGVGGFDTALQRMTRRVSQAAKGSGEAVKTLDELGLNAKELAKLTADEQFLAISDAMKEVKDQGDRVRLTFGLFDSEGVNLVNTLKLGSDAIKEAGSDIDKYGLAMDRVDTARIEMANDSWTRLEAITNGIWDQFAAQGAPIITALIEMFLEGAERSGNFGEIAGVVFDWVAWGIGKAIDSWSLFMGAWRGSQAIVTDVIAFTIRQLGHVEQTLVSLGGKSFDFGLASLAKDLTGEAAKLRQESFEHFDNGLSGKGSENFFKRLEDVKDRAKKNAEFAINSSVTKPEIQASEQQKKPTRGPESVGAFQKGSAEAISAINKRGKDPVESAIKEGNKRLEKVLNKVDGRLKSIDKKTEKEEVL